MSDRSITATWCPMTDTGTYVASPWDCRFCGSTFETCELTPSPCCGGCLDADHGGHLDERGKAQQADEEATVHVEPEWPLLTAFSVNLLGLPTHQHGPNGPHYLTHDQAVNMLHACIKAMEATR